MPIFPLHTWQPDTYTDALTQGTMLLSGIMLKMGIYGVIRWLIPIVPDAMHECEAIAIFFYCTRWINFSWSSFINYGGFAGCNVPDDKPRSKCGWIIFYCRHFI